MEKCELLAPQPWGDIHCIDLCHLCYSTCTDSYKGEMCILYPKRNCPFPRIGIFELTSWELSLELSRNSSSAPDNCPGVLLLMALCIHIGEVSKGKVALL